MKALDEIRARDAAAECVAPSCHRTAADRRELLLIVDELTRLADLRMERLLQVLDENKALKQAHDLHRFEPDCPRCTS